MHVRVSRASLPLGLLLILAPPGLDAQQASIQGLVTQTEGERPLEGASVTLESPEGPVAGTFTQRDGFYQIGGLEPGPYTVRVQYIGHLPHEQSVLLSAGPGVTLSIRLQEDPLVLEGVSAGPVGGAAVREFGRQRITAGDIRLVPVPGGSGDLASYLQSLPGVVSTGDRGGQLFIRGGTPAENLALVDGMIIYQPFHILGFFSVFPENLVSSVDFYPGGFGARYQGRTSSVLDVRMRDGKGDRHAGTGSVSPFLAEGVVEGPLGENRSFIASARKSLIEETSPLLLGSREPLNFESQLLKLSATVDEAGSRCSATAIRTADDGRLDAEDPVSRVGWSNLVFGSQCVMLFESALRLLEVSFSYSALENEAVTRGSSNLSSGISRLHHEAHSTTRLGAIPVFAGYHVYLEHLNYDLAELFGLRRADDAVTGIGGYVEGEIPLAESFIIRPGAVVRMAPSGGVEPRLRAQWQPFGRPTEQLSAALGLYSQELTGISDMRDVSSVFTAWSPTKNPLEATHALLGWQQEIGGGIEWSVEAYSKWLRNVPIPQWRATTQFNTSLGTASGRIRGADARLEFRSPLFYGFIGYGYASTQYEATQEAFNTWFGEPVQRYRPPHDRRHQVNTTINLNLGRFTAGARWQLGSGLPFTRPLGFDEAFDFRLDLQNVNERLGTTRVILDKPYQGRLPVMHRLDLSVEVPIETRFGLIEAQAGVVNAYNRKNMFFYDLYTGRRVDQLPIAPFVSLTLATL